VIAAKMYRMQLYFGKRYNLCAKIQMVVFNIIFKG
jgi:hypothetical protein